MWSCRTLQLPFLKVTLNNKSALILWPFCGQWSRKWDKEKCAVTSMSVLITYLNEAPNSDIPLDFFTSQDIERQEP